MVYYCSVDFLYSIHLFVILDICILAIYVVVVLDTQVFTSKKKTHILLKEAHTSYTYERTQEPPRLDKTQTHPHQRSSLFHTRGWVIGDFGDSLSTGRFLSVVGVCPQTKCSIVLTSRTNPLLKRPVSCRSALLF